MPAFKTRLARPVAERALAAAGTTALMLAPVNPTATPERKLPLAEIDTMDGAEFVRRFGPVFEHSPWIAERAAVLRPFRTLDAMHAAMCSIVRAASAEDQLSLVRAHPDLVGNAVITSESRGEQAAAGLLDLSPAEVALFDRYNREYKARFGFPFVICARLNRKDAILAAFPLRLANDAARERGTALEEIFKIARMRLADLITE